MAKDIVSGFSCHDAGSVPLCGVEQFAVALAVRLCTVLDYLPVRHCDIFHAD